MATHIDMPDALIDVIRSWTVTELGRVAPDDIVPLLRFECPDGATEKPGGHKIKKAG